MSPKPFDPAHVPGVSSKDSSTSALLWPQTAHQRGKGPFSMPKTEIRCQVTTPHGICDRRLAGVSGEAKPTGRTVSDLVMLRSGEAGAYCPRCKRVSVYVMIEQEAA